MKFETLQDRVVVITGASSGIGKRAVERFLEEGAKVVLAARSGEEMQEHIGRLGYSDEFALVVPTDVTDYEQVKNLATQARRHFGQIDIWINNAAVNIYGKVDELEIAEIRQVIDTNLMGEIHGMKAVLPILKDQGYGNLINISSVYGKVAAPLESAYNASKFGIIGFTKALREELMHDGFKDIDVSLVLPPSIDTPLFIHAKSKLGVEPKPMPPTYSPDLIANALIDVAKHPKPEVLPGMAAKTFNAASRFTPNLMERFMAAVGIGGQKTDRPMPVEGYDNLLAPMPNTQTVRGDLGTTSEHMIRFARQHPLRIAIGFAIPLLLVGLTRRLRPV